jgi:hypothetical protein
MTDPTPAAGVSHKSETPAHRSPQLRNNRLIVRAQPSSQLAEVSLDLYLSDPHSPLALAQARLAAESLISTGALIVRDSRAPREANDRFIDLFEDYFAQDQDALKADERPEVGYQVVSTSTVRKSIVPRLEKIRCSVELSLTEPGSHPRKYGEAKVLFRRGMSRYHRLTRCGGAAARRDGPWRGSEVPVCELLHSSGRAVGAPQRIGLQSAWRWRHLADSDRPPVTGSFTACRNVLRTRPDFPCSRLRTSRPGPSRGRGKSGSTSGEGS